MSRRQPNMSRPLCLWQSEVQEQGQTENAFEISPVFIVFFIVSYLYFQTTVGNATEVAGGPRTSAVSDGELHFQQELHDAQNEIKVSS